MPAAMARARLRPDGAVRAPRRRRRPAPRPHRLRRPGEQAGLVRPSRHRLDLRGRPRDRRPPRRRAAAAPLPPRSPVGLCMAGMAEAHLAFLAIEQAGHVPCLLPVTWDEDRLLQAVESAQILAILTQGVLGPSGPPRRCAGSRCAISRCASSPPSVRTSRTASSASTRSSSTTGRRRRPRHRAGRRPRDLRAARRSPGRPAGPPPEPAGAPVAVRREAEALTAAAAGCLAPMRVEPGDRILSLMPPSDLKGLATGLAAALLAGATLECHPVFEPAPSLAALDQPVPTHLVAPAWMEAGFARTTVAGRLRTLAYVHRAPCRLSGRLRAGRRRSTSWPSTRPRSCAAGATPRMSPRPGGPGAGRDGAREGRAGARARRPHSREDADRAG